MKKKGEEMQEVLEQRFLLQPMVKTMISREMRPWGSGSVNLISSERVEFERLFHLLLWLPDPLLGKE